MLNRSQAVKRLIEIRKIMNTGGQSDEYTRIVQELERLIKDMIGNQEEEQARLLNKILLKAFSDEVTTETAMVAIHEVVASPGNSAGNSTSRQSNRRKKTTHVARRRESKEELIAKGYK